jgi:hypothetical protein
MAKWLVLLGVCLVPAFGQDVSKGEVFGTIGIGKTYDDEGSLGSGINGGGGIGYRLTGRLGVEAEVNAFRTKRDFSFTPNGFEASGAFIMGNGLLYLTRGRGQLYLIGGAGLLHIRNQFGFTGVAVNRSGNGLAVDVGMGLKIFATPRFYLRPDVRVYAGNSGSTVEAPFSDIRISIGAGYCW